MGPHTTAVYADLCHVRHLQTAGPCEAIEGNVSVVSKISLPSTGTPVF
jgi:hypothetical protein